ncbi:MAG: DNA starvation/stationary phase protection protein [Leptospiraceae bacterium]|nr:DNA starvation/stationary phase protection protein [Leptospiraceae bacterium]MCK6382473.1 DNA starvation/stationary phase protection protein [Leptospiraceae bacterium]NUM42420.1 DNA starvation/stationary phase protection protein [Leptospiraceae bacterium]
MVKMDIGISDSNRKEISEGLSKLLADTYTLYHKTHGYHWNVTGPMFNTLHLMFMEQYTELWNSIDVIAERIRSLGFFAPSGYSELAKLTSISDDKEVPNAENMLSNLVSGNEAVIKTARGILKSAESANDQASLDLLTQRLNVHEKTAWMLRSMLDA